MEGGIDAIYKQENQFKISANLTEKFVPGRRIKADCGTDGFQYSEVVQSDYDTNNYETIVTIDDDVLTNELERVWYSSTSSGDSGSLPLHTHVDDSEGGKLSFGQGFADYVAEDANELSNYIADSDPDEMIYVYPNEIDVSSVIVIDKPMTIYGSTGAHLNATGDNSIFKIDGTTEVNIIGLDMISAATTVPVIEIADSEECIIRENKIDSVHLAIEETGTSKNNIIQDNTLV